MRNNTINKVIIKEMYAHTQHVNMIVSKPSFLHYFIWEYFFQFTHPLFQEHN